jgi:phosphoglycerate dehydrogenase-like enzyme
MKNKTSRNVLLAIPRDYERFVALWTAGAADLSANLNLNIHFIDKTPMNLSGWNQALSGFQAIITSWCTPPLNRVVMENNETIALIAHAAGSVSDLVSELPRPDIMVTTANPIMASSVAEWCMAMTWVGLANMLKYANFGGLRPLNWNKTASDFRNIRNSIIGIWGYGDISAEYIHFLKAFSPKKILMHSSHFRSAEDAIEPASLEDMFSQADAIVLLAALNTTNEGRVGTDLLRRLKPGAVLLNPGRGRLIDEGALITALNQGRFTYIADAFHREPLPDNDLLQHFTNVILTPHCAGRNTGQFVPAMLREVRRFYNGEALHYAVTRERLKTMTSNRLNYG